MLEENGKFRKPIWVNFAVLTLLLVTSGFTLSACKMPISGGKSTEQQKENQPVKTEQQTSDQQQKGNQPAKSGQQKNNKPAIGDDTTDDDDPE
jgi:hypothetical protein